MSKHEHLGYPTQKPLALYDRITKASSNPGDLILDPFAGCGTTVEAAIKNNRRVIGIDILPFALRLINRHRILPEWKAGIPCARRACRQGKLRLNSRHGILSNSKTGQFP